MLRRYLAREIAAPFAAWTALLLVLFYVLAFLRGTDVLLGSAVTGRDFALLAFYLAPQFLMQALPVAFLLSLQLGLGRLAEDGEIRAMAALGVAPRVFFRGPLVLGALASAGLVVLAFTAQPWGLYQAHQMSETVIRRNLLADLVPGQFHQEVQAFTLYAEQVQPGNRWTHVLLSDMRDPNNPLIVVAKTGNVTPGDYRDLLTFTLHDGAVHRLARGRDEYAVARFEQASFVADIVDALVQKNRFRSINEEMTPADLLEGAELARARGESDRPLLVAFHWRVGQLMMPLAFALVGAPLALVRRGKGRASGVVLTLGLFVGYYVVARMAVQFGEKHDVPMLLAGQAANLISLAVGLVLLWQIERKGAV
jgi:lipopolysaccharide export system permease protein